MTGFDMLDPETERQWKAHIAATGCQRPREVGELCVQVGLMAFPRSRMGAVADHELNAALAGEYEACRTAKHKHGLAGLLDCILANWGQDFLARVKALDHALGRQGCTPEAWRRLVPKRWFE